MMQRKIAVNIAVFLTALSAMLILFTNVYAKDNISVYVNDAKVAFDTDPIIENSRTLVPMRAVFEALGADVSWDQATYTATAVKDDTTIVIAIGSDIMEVNDRDEALDVPAALEDDRTLVPLRAVSQALGYDVVWDDALKTAFIGSHNYLDELNSKISSMTLGEKIYQMMFTTPEAITGYSRVTAAGEVTRTALETYPVGGLIYFSQNIESESQVKTMLANTKTYAKTPLFLGVDEEGGRVARLGNAGIGFPQFPAMSAIGAAGDLNAAYELGTNLGSALRDYGFNLDFAPDADVLVSADNAIGDRSFGSDPTLVSNMAVSVASGLQDSGVSATVKHFPGHGGTSGDTHDGFVMTSRNYEEMSSSEFKPFEAAAENGVDFTMVAHVAAPSITGSDLPSTMSGRMVGILRYDLGFNGVIITDALNMGAIANNYTTGSACVSAVQAGVDMLLMPVSLDEAYSSIANAVSDGTISEDRIDQSVKRILNAKMRRGLFG